MNRTKIEWVKNPDGTQGYTWNPITGCLNHVKGMCKGGGFPCYAYRLAHGRLKNVYLANVGLPELYGTKCVFDRADTEAAYDEHIADPFYPRFWPEKMWLHQLVGSKRKPKGIFVCDMSDLFGIGVPEEWTRRVLGVIRKHPRHRFYLLTKQPQNLSQWSPFPDNVYLGVTVCNQAMFDKAVYYLKMVEARVKFLSMEPMLGRITIES
ncbi:hypothetical protein LCGC14_0420350 [marine sediment metagenome]|uniref:Uncharacterized protein n=1 Tax=marine sediment metagenome TaxID=412755 RepID=A0A0F9VD16_9ZZZZ